MPLCARHTDMRQQCVIEQGN